MTWCATSMIDPQGSRRCSTTPRTTCWPLRVSGRALAQAEKQNPLERFNREIARRTDVVGIFPADASLIRLVSMLAIEANDEWLVGRSYISQKSMATLSDPRLEPHPPLDQEKEEIGRASCRERV